MARKKTKKDSAPLSVRLMRGILALAKSVAALLGLLIVAAIVVAVLAAQGIIPPLDEIRSLIVDVVIPNAFEFASITIGAVLIGAFILHEIDDWVMRQ